MNMETNIPLSFPTTRRARKAWKHNFLLKSTNRIVFMNFQKKEVFFKVVVISTILRIKKVLLYPSKEMYA
jgi:hypothetical protein